MGYQRPWHRGSRQAAEVGAARAARLCCFGDGSVAFGEMLGRIHVTRPQASSYPRRAQRRRVAVKDRGAPASDPVGPLASDPGPAAALQPGLPGRLFPEGAADCFADAERHRARQL